MRLDAKAWENLDAAEHLLATKTHDTFPNASSSRAYCAAYLAVANRLLCLALGWGSDRAVTSITTSFPRTPDSTECCRVTSPMI